MLSTLRVASRSAAAREANFVVIGARQASAWSKVPQGPPDAILGITEAFKADSFKEKINLGVGAYRMYFPPSVALTRADPPDTSLFPIRFINYNHVLNYLALFQVMTRASPTSSPSVRAAEDKVVASRSDKEYAGITGIPAFTNAAAELAYGTGSPVIKDDRLVITQTISGTGALRIGGAFLERFYPGAKKVYLPNPSWANHNAVFKDSGLEVEKYRYYNKDTIGLDFEGLIEDIKAAPEGSIILLHACAHNPTGVDPTEAQWRQISDVMKQKGHFAFFDMAYQGFASGNADKDAFAPVTSLLRATTSLCARVLPRTWASMVSVSVLSPSSARTPRRRSVLSLRSRFSFVPSTLTPPIHGARVASAIMNDPSLNQQWLGEVKGMADRIIEMRKLLRENLEKLGSKHDWSHITSQIGMFAFTGLKPEQMDALAKEHSVYATKDGRISVAGITSGNVQRLAESIFKVTG
ncbi:pyridoxal phosphate-dependent transferase [Penicillium hetheringtonii]|uniref:aspartate transaminase n=1 Tax=Penicillium hetheringtonii TaxID=911720 RepID=A0AAD6DWP5_9EURO|nr:pyridoxal phosphate-dependent transferase [Penicillium hetheringtonii]